MLSDLKPPCYRWENVFVTVYTPDPNPTVQLFVLDVMYTMDACHPVNQIQHPEVTFLEWQNVTLAVLGLNL